MVWNVAGLRKWKGGGEYKFRSAHLLHGGGGGSLQHHQMPFGRARDDAARSRSGKDATAPRVEGAGER
jgi:hypothetical protein